MRGWKHMITICKVVVALQLDNVLMKLSKYVLSKYGTLQLNDRIYVPTENEIKKMILQEIPNVPHVGHPGYQNTLTTIKKEYYWLGMKKKVTKYIDKYLKCQRVKT